ncbi:MAG: hypothetical protein CMJ45_03015 [Planctomyces sp.]|nr:hypothetical protein [Planctomycetaceae bacterium]MBQ10502.1 hypothetical protein [Planctomyces sp.]
MPRKSKGSDVCQRREFLRVGTLAGLSLAEVMLLQKVCAAETRKSDDINCIFIFALGGMPQQDMWDLKPEGPAETRGDFSPISTNVPGIQISELLPQISKVVDKLAILRSLTHEDSDHGRGIHIMMSGRKAGVGDFNTGDHDNNQHPCIGSMVARLGKVGELPPYISLPNFLNSGGAAFLGPSYGPFVIAADPAAPEFKVRDISLPTSMTSERSVRRQLALREINRFSRRVEEVSRSARSLDAFYQKAYGLMTSQKAKEAFEVDRESEAMRQRYGMTSVGQCALLGRRLVEAGCRFVSIENGHWDTHRKNSWSLREVLCPSFDQGVSALIEDLSDRGMLEKTLVVVTTEFGRTPQINDLDGRDHWPGAFSVVMAGAGIQGGQVIGATDKQAATVTDRPITPQDLAATILSVLGIDHKTVLYTPVGRPVPLVGDGTPVNDLFT